MRRADLSGADLRRADLSGADLSEANLSEVKQRVVQISATRHQIVAIDDEVRIGCRRQRLGWWVDNYQEVGEAEGYSEAEIELYGRLLKALVIDKPTA